MSRHALSSRPRPAPPTANSRGGSYLLVEQPGDRPDEPGQFTRDSRQRLVGTNACVQMSIPVVEAQLSSPGQFDDRCWHLELALLERSANARGMAGVVRRLAKDVPQRAITSFGDGTTMLLAATGTLRRHRTGIGHELRCGSETMQVASFGNDGHGRHKANAAERLQGTNAGHLLTGLRTLAQGGLQSFDAFTSRGHFSQIISEHHAIGQML